MLHMFGKLVLEVDDTLSFDAFILSIRVLSSTYTRDMPSDQLHTASPQGSPKPTNSLASIITCNISVRDCMLVVMDR